jgi:integrase
VKGDGSVYQTHDGGGRLRWVAALPVPGRTTHVRRMLPVGADERAAKRKLRELRDQRARGDLSPGREEPEIRSLPTMAEAASAWVAAGFPGGRKKNGPCPRTMRLQEDFVRLRIAPSTLGETQLDAVRRRTVAAFLKDQADAGASRSTVQKLRGIIGRVYRHAQLLHEEELGERGNPADVELPRTKDNRARRALLPDEVLSLLMTVADHTFLDAWIRLAIDTGMRPGEQAALTWSDFDLRSDPATVTVVKAVAWDPVDGHVLARLNETKTGEPGHRRLTLSSSTVSVLREYRKWLAAEELATPGYWADQQDGVSLSGRVFRRLDGLLIDNQYVGRRLGPAAKDAKIGKVTPYDTRHTAATFMDEFLPPGIASRALGHGADHGSVTTAGYIHRRITTVPSAVLDLALEHAEPRAAAR